MSNLQGYTMNGETFYAILGVDRAADDKSLHRAFLRKARQYHPDRLADASAEERRASERIMQEITEAFAILRNRDQRELYDRCLREGLDYALESARVPASAAAKAQAAAECNVTELAAKVRDAASSLPELPPLETCSEHAFFDWTLHGRVPGARLNLYIKALPEMTPENVTQLIRALDDTPVENAVLSRVYQTVIVATPRTLEAATVRELLKSFNAQSTSVPRGRPIRGMGLLRTDRDQPFVPFGEYLKPDITTLSL